MSTPLWCSVMPSVQHSWARSARGVGVGELGDVVGGDAGHGLGPAPASTPRPTPRTRRSRDVARSTKVSLYEAGVDDLAADRVRAARCRCRRGGRASASAQRAAAVRRGSTTNSRAPLRTPARTWWKKIGWVSRAFEPHRTMTSVFSTSGRTRCHRRLRRLSPDRRRWERVKCGCRSRCCSCRWPTRTNFWARKFISFVAFEHENTRPRRDRGRPPPGGSRRRPGRAPRPTRRGAAAVLAHQRLGQPG